MMSTTGRPDLPPGNPDAFAAIMALPATPSREDRIATAPSRCGAPSAVRAFRRPTRNCAPPPCATSTTPIRPGRDRPPDGGDHGGAAANDRLKGSKPLRSSFRALNDPLPASSGEDTAKSIPGAELLLVPGLGHDFNELAARVYLEAIGGFKGRGADARSGLERDAIGLNRRRHRGLNPRNRGVDAKRTGRRPRIHANLLQGLPIAVLSVFKGLEKEPALIGRTRTAAACRFSRLASRNRACASRDGSHTRSWGLKPSKAIPFPGANSIFSSLCGGISGPSDFVPTLLLSPRVGSLWARRFQRSRRRASGTLPEPA